MMRSWPLDSFRNQPPKSQGRGSNPWNGSVGRKCFDCKNVATLWVETTITNPPVPPVNVLYYTTAPAKSYAKLCEPCYTLRILGDHEEAR